MARNEAWASMSVAIVLLAAMGLGCPGSEVLQSDPAQLTLTLAVEPAGAGRFELGNMRVNEVTFRPVDPQADAALGVESISFFPSPLSVNISQGGDITVPAIVMTEGLYRVDRVTLESPTFTDTDSPNPATCQDNTVSCLDKVLSDPNRVPVGRLPAGDEVTRLNIPSALPNPSSGSATPFSVNRGGVGSIRIRIDGPSLAAAFQAAFSCRCTGFCGDSNHPAPCLTSFTPLTTAQVQSVIHFD